MSEDHVAYDDGVELVGALVAQELRVLGLLLSNRRVAAPIAREAGLSSRHFSQEDYRLIFATWEVACEDDMKLIDTLRLIRRALQANGFWDVAALPGSDWSKHSDATIAALASTPMTADEYADSMCAVGWEGDWLGYAIARNVAALVGAVEMMEAK